DDAGGRGDDGRSHRRAEVRAGVPVVAGAAARVVGATSPAPMVEAVVEPVAAVVGPRVAHALGERRRRDREDRASEERMQQRTHARRRYQEACPDAPTAAEARTSCSSGGLACGLDSAAAARLFEN